MTNAHMPNGEDNSNAYDNKIRSSSYGYDTS